MLEGLLCLDKNHEEVIRSTPSDKPVMMTLDALDDFGGYIAAEANHCKDEKKRNKLDAVFKKIEGLLDKYTDEEPPKTIKFEDASKNRAISDQAVQIASWAAQALVAAEQLGIKKKPLERLQLAPSQRDVLLLVPGVSKAIKNKLAKESSFTVAEVAGMLMALAEDLTEGDARKQLAVLLVAKHLMDQLQERIVGPATPIAPAHKPTKRAKKAAESSKPDEVGEVLEVIVGMIDQFCREHLNEEYVVLCRRLAEKLSRKRPSPLLSGRPNTWACGIIRTIGWVNFLDDRSQTPHMKLTAIDKAFGVGESTGQGKSKAIRSMLKIRQFDHNWTLPSRLDENPMIWMLEVNGFIMDIRNCPREMQERAFEKGLIPYVPADHD